MNNVDEFYGKIIADIEYNESEDFILITFKDGIKIKIEDKGQCCCEHRYMTINDDLSMLKGEVLRVIEITEYAYVDDDPYGEHDVAFLRIFTNRDSVTIANHNEHNGYYGGFDLRVEKIR